MSIDSVLSFFRRTKHGPAGAWNYDLVADLAGQDLPHVFYGDELPLLRGDQHRLWLRWFVEGLLSPHAFARDTVKTRFDVFAAVSDRIIKLYGQAAPTVRESLAELITDHIFYEVEHLRRPAQRDHASADTKRALIAEAGTPRCYICGFAFSVEAQHALLKVKDRDPVAEPILTDVFRPRTSLRDVRIEIDHLVPVKHGGQGTDNFRLACGWCNKYKSAYMSLYEVPVRAAWTSGFQLGSHRLFELPTPFWSIRLLGLKGRCQHDAGCQATPRDAELFVALKDWSGSPNPTNLALYCNIHDPIAADRMQPIDIVKRIWADASGRR